MKNTFSSEKAQKLLTLPLDEQYKLLYTWIKQDNISLKEFTTLGLILAESQQKETQRQIGYDTFD